jgi:hypothetical protein
VVSDVRKLAFLIALSTLATHGPHAGADAAPKLVVMLAVDQMRADYVDRFGANWAPTLAALCGITMPRAEGHPLRAAMTIANPTSVSPPPGHSQ